MQNGRSDGTLASVNGTTRMRTAKQFDYTFDTVGNRTQTEAGGDQTGANLRLAHYTNNVLNQITSRDVPGDVDVMGLLLASNTVTVNSNTPYRRGEYFREQLAVTNTSATVWTNITVASPGQASVSGHAYVARTPETNTYDLDGNLLSDGRWTYSWDAEDRLTNMTSLSGAPSGSQLNLSFVYDYMGRRIQKIVSTNNSGSNIVEYTDNYAYDGWNCVAILNSSLGLVNSFLWGTDLSGSMQGAGGVGGLVQVNYYGSSPTNGFVAYDGNGNVVALLNAADGSTLSLYEYGPFGELIRATGPMAKLNPFRFSTKYDDDESDFLYYGYRYYNPSTGRWFSRDPEQEDGGLNLYGFVGNHPVNAIDKLGLWETKVHHDIIDQWLDASYDNYPWRCCAIPVRELLKNGSDEVDGVGAWALDCLSAQSFQNTYQHAMRAPGETIMDAQQKYDAFLNFNIGQAMSLSDQARNGNSIAGCNLIFQAVHDLGRAYHAFSDSLSPAHEGFQEWNFDPQQMEIHHSKETFEVYEGMQDQVVGEVKSKFDGPLAYVLAIQVFP